MAEKAHFYSDWRQGFDRHNSNLLSLISCHESQISNSSSSSEQSDSSSIDDFISFKVARDRSNYRYSQGRTLEQLEPLTPLTPIQSSSRSPSFKSAIPPPVFRFSAIELEKDLRITKSLLLK